MIEIVINGRFLTQPMTGVQRYAYEVTRAFDQMMASGEIDSTIYSLVLATPPNLDQYPDFKYIKVKQVGRLKGNLWEQVSLPIYARNKLLFNPCNTGPILSGSHQITTIHDASVFAVPQAYSSLFRLKYKLIIKFMCKATPQIITVSQFSRNEISHYCGIPSDKITVIPEGCDHILRYNEDCSILERYDLGKRPFIIAVSSNSIHKNFNIILKALSLIGESEINFDVVIIGGEYKKVFKKTQYHFPEYIKQVGYISDEALRCLYKNAACLIYPSFYEGFGLPPLEAMACGCPVIVSNAASLAEVCGDAALYFEPRDPNYLANQVRKLMDDPILRKELCLKGFHQGRKFQWVNAAKEIRKLLFEI